MFHLEAVPPTRQRCLTIMNRLHSNFVSTCEKELQGCDRKVRLLHHTDGDAMMAKLCVTQELLRTSDTIKKICGML